MPRILSNADVADFRERLCEAAADIFVELGHDRFNMRELAGRMGISAMTPYRYFKNKEDIFSAVRARAFGRFADRLEIAQATPGSAAEKSAAVARAYIQFALEERAHYKLMFDMAQPQVDTLSTLALQERRARATMTEHVRNLVDEGIFEGDPELIGPVMWSALHGAVVLHLAGKFDDADFNRVLTEIMRVFGRAYRPDAMPPSREAGDGAVRATRRAN